MLLAWRGILRRLHAAVCWDAAAVRGLGLGLVGGVGLVGVVVVVCGEALFCFALCVSCSGVLLMDVYRMMLTYVTINMYVFTINVYIFM